MDFRLSVRSVAVALAVWIGLLTAANLVTIFLLHGLGIQPRSGIARLFLFNAEANIPSFFQAVALLGCGGLLACVAASAKQRRDPFYLHWVVLALIFVYLGFDEASEIHELATAPARRLVPATGVFRLTWVVFAIPAIAVFVAAYLSFLVSLPRSYRTAFILCGGVFVAGALGVEMLGGVYLDRVGEYDGGYALITTAEELLEKLGVAAFFVTLLAYLRDHTTRVGLRLTS